MKRQSPQAKANRRNANANARAPLFAWAGLVPQVTATQVEYDDLARAIASYEKEVAWDRYQWAKLNAYVAMLDAAIGAENREEVLADMLSRGAYIKRTEYQLEYLCRYLATYLKRPPLEIYEEAEKRLDGLF